MKTKVEKIILKYINKEGSAVWSQNETYYGVPEKGMPVEINGVIYWPYKSWGDYKKPVLITLGYILMSVLLGYGFKLLVSGQIL